MDAQTARNIGALLQRVDIKGSEVQAFNQIMATLAEIINAEEGEGTVHVAESEQE